MAKILPCGRSQQPVKSKRYDPKALFKKLDSFIDRKLLNRSVSRERTLRVILSFKKHFSISDLVGVVHKKYPKIGAASVYRNVPLFVEAGILCESFSDTKGQPLYEVDKEGHHDHIVCIDCNAIFEFFDAALEGAQDRITSHLEFKPISHRHVVYAKCQRLFLRPLQK